MAAVLAAAPAGHGLCDALCPDRVAIPLTEDSAVGGRMRRSVGLYFDQMEITTIMHRRLGGNQWPVPAENELPVTVRRR